MIDCAGPLKDLGGVDGPVTGELVEGGAVPDGLLDIQEELERDVEKLGSKVTWCRKLEKQWELYVLSSSVAVPVHDPLTYTVPIYNNWLQREQARWRITSSQN